MAFLLTLLPVAAPRVGLGYRYARRGGEVGEVLSNQEGQIWVENHCWMHRAEDRLPMAKV